MFGSKFGNLTLGSIQFPRIFPSCFCFFWVWPVIYLLVPIVWPFRRPGCPAINKSFCCCSCFSPFWLYGHAHSSLRYPTYSDLYPTCFFYFLVSLCIHHWVSCDVSYNCHFCCSKLSYGLGLSALVLAYVIISLKHVL